MRIAFTTLGCKINQFETDALQQDLLSRGNSVVPFDAEADVYIINTCSVTAKSDTQSRQLIRSAVRRAHGARVVVTGCYAEMRPEEIQKIPGVGLVIGNRDKARISDQVMTMASAGSPESLPASERALNALHTRTRGFLKIQDGCDNRCSYCVVPLARGGSRSAKPGVVLREFKHLVDRGCPEVVLTGVHVGSYGSDLEEGISLTDMLLTLVQARGRTRIRLSSIEPNEITREMINYLGQGLCRHLHIPLQSGDDSILASMKRNYNSRFYEDLLEQIASRVPGVALGADIIVGYPGEGEKEFQNTMSLVERSPLTHLHVFSYSPRPGTPAAEMKGQVPEPIKKERSASLRRLGMNKNLLFRKKHQGSKLNVVVEDKLDRDTGLLTGLTDNYIRVMISGAKTGDIGKKINIMINEVKEQGNFGLIL
ncbi:MAG: tRNA (N(6)-L-threonylcarbamoyladenosine(37)-C(2))-methylthiotransferase MtaB [Nitrospirae bacterium]|nr:tRNA (N(6)-L-threonylcarbamoyladenosine(37)-C(2))-methylthiotransferase MtaB [Nitrospirota bacterium]